MSPLVAPDLGRFFSLTGTVHDSGGGEVRVLVDRDADYYPTEGQRVSVTLDDDDRVFIVKDIYDEAVARYDEAALCAHVCLYAIRSRLDEHAQEAVDIVLAKIKEARDARHSY